MQAGRENGDRVDMRKPISWVETHIDDLDRQLASLAEFGSRQDAGTVEALDLDVCF